MSRKKRHLDQKVIISEQLNNIEIIKTKVGLIAKLKNGFTFHSRRGEFYFRQKQIDFAKDKKGYL